MAADATEPSLQPDIPFGDQLHRAFHLRDGLPSSWINDVIQTRDDYLWIATDNGLVRYDGFRFKLFDRTVTRQLPFNEIRVLYEDHEGSLWIGTTAGLTRYKSGRPGAFVEASTVSGKAVRAVREDGAGTLWIGTEEETFVRGHELDFEIVEDAPTNVRAICEDQNGTLWFGSHYGLFRRQGTAYERITHERLPKHTSTEAGVPQARVNAILAEDEGGLWIGANRALLHMQDGEFTSRGREIDSQQIYDIKQTRNGGLYVAARFGLYRSVGDGPFEKVSSEESAFCVMEDRDGGLWIGHGDNRGLHCYRNNYAQAIWSEATVRCVHEDSGGDLWFGSNNGLHRLRDGVVTDYGLEDGMPDPRIQTIVQGAGETLWIGTAKGFAKWSGSTIVSDVAPAVPAEMNIGVALEDSTGVLWFSLASNGGFTLKDGVLCELPAFRNGRIHWFWEDRRGTIWIGHESGLFRHRDGRIWKVSEAAFGRLHSPRFLCHFASADGTLWMGTSNGIVRHQSDRFDVFAPDCGLRADNIERLVADHDGNLWFGGRDGLFHVRKAELDAVAAGRLSHVTSYRIEGFDRFPPLRAFSQGCLVRNDDLWIVAERGLMKMPIEPLLRKPRPPTVHIEHATVDGKAANFEQPFEYLTGRRRLSIQFAVPAFLDPRHVQIRYRLDRHDAHWINAGSDRVVHYTDLRPGEYKFRASAREGNGEWIEADPPMRFTVQPRWWETVWFRALAVFGAIGLIYVSVKQYTRSVRKRNIVLRKEIHERKQAEEKAHDYLQQLARVNRAASMGEMATSIAHEVNQPLFAIVSNAQTAKRLLDREQPDIAEVRDALDDIASDGNRAANIIGHVRARVRKGRHPTEQLDLNQVAREAVQFVGTEIRQRGLSLRADLADDLPAINGNSIELQQVILNLIINGAQSMRDAPTGSRGLLLRTSAEDGFVELAVQDRGVGFDEELADRLFEPFFTTKPDGTGMGLAINRTIIEAHGGRIWATSNDDRGATFHFRLPALNQTPEDKK